jgi:endonuclease G, mitochondrial
MFRALLSAALVLFLNVSLKAQDTVRLSHKEYVTVFSKSLRYPVLVEWWVTKNKVQCNTPIPRQDKFAPDPLLAAHTDLANDYIKSGYDRGHMAPAADNQCSGKDAMIESFYFSNMTPQHGQLNRGDWKTLEMRTREIAKSLDSIKVWTGSVGEKIKIGTVSVPDKCWKVIYIKSKKEWKAYIFNNDQSKADGIENNEVKVKEVEKLTNFKFKIN